MPAIFSFYSTIGLTCMLLVFCLPPLRSQSPPPYGIFLEGGGVANYYSLNVTRRFVTTPQFSAYGRIGVGVWQDVLAVPLGITALWGRSAHHPELTLAINPYSEGLQFWDRDESDIKLDLVFGLGYRYQPEAGRIFVGVGIFPYLRLDPTSDVLSEGRTQFRLRPGLCMGWFPGR